MWGGGRGVRIVNCNSSKYLQYVPMPLLPSLPNLTPLKHNKALESLVANLIIRVKLMVCIYIVYTENINNTVIR